MTPRKLTVPKEVLGTSMPTTGLPGTGASMRIVGAASASARSLASEVILSTLTRVRETSSSLSPASPFSSLPLTFLVFISQPGSMPNWVTVGPTFICTTLAFTP